MMQATGTRPLLKAGNITFSAGLSALVGSIILWLALLAFALFVLNYSLPKAALVAVAALLVHWVGDLLHQLGHAFAARSTGYPIVGIHLWGVLSSTVYPPDEPALPATVHVRRAIGGPLVSVVVTVLAGLVLLLLRIGSAIWWVDFFFVLDNLLVFTLGSMLPLGFTDGSTLIRLSRTRGQ